MRARTGLALALGFLGGCRGFFDTRPVPLDGPPADTTVGSDAAIDAPGPRSFGFVQGSVADLHATTFTVGLAVPEHATDLDIIAIWWTGTASITGIDDGGNEIVSAIGPMGINGANQAVYVASLADSGSGGTVVVTLSAASDGHVAVGQYSGLAGIDTATGSFGTNSAASTGALTTTGSDEVLLGVVGADVVSGAATLAGFAPHLGGTGNVDTYFVGDNSVSIAQQYSAGGTSTIGGDWIAQLIAFKRLAP